MKKALLYFGLLFMTAIITFSSCKKDDDNNNNNNDNNNLVLKFLNITNAKSLVIMNSSGKKDGKGVNDDSENKLFKITDNGIVLEVPCINENGDTVTSNFSPIGICNLSDNYLTVTFQNYGTYLVRKTDGAVFTGNNLPKSAPDPGSDRADLFIQRDGLGNIYYWNNFEVMKLTITDPNNLTISTYSAFGDQVGGNSYNVDNAGNLCYGTRFRHASGGLENNANCGYGWTDINNDSIYVWGPQGNGTGSIFRIIPTTPLGFELYGDTSYSCPFDPPRQLVKIKNKNKIIGTTYSVFYDLYNPNEIVIMLPLSHFNIPIFTMLAASDNYYYILGENSSLQSVLLKVDPNGHTFTNLLTTGDYDLYNVVVSKTDEVQFYALRMSDGKRVLAKIDNAGNITILSVLDGSTITVLEQIN